ncbi:helix-turn-helix domain-containing protein [Fructilactobacillus sp. Tb1]|uniref:helix-turn-helix domain-containing protein n=1 Tax=Fructilactobacillus sp. Tb1 TaxID=3422304 RepID=UPI003D2C6E6E
MKLTQKEKNELGNRIKAIRLQLGLDQPQFADKVVPIAKSSNVSRWENGINVPNAKRLKSIAELGNVSVDYLINGLTNNNKIKLKKGTTILEALARKDNEQRNFMDAGTIAENKKIEEMINIIFSSENIEQLTEEQSGLIYWFLQLFRNLFKASNSDDPFLSNDVYMLYVHMENLLQGINDNLTKKIEKNINISDKQSKELNETLRDIEDTINTINPEF